MNNNQSKRLNIAIDGPAGAGKSTIAGRLASELNILYLDTGAMYRAVALKALRTNFDPKVTRVEDFLQGLKIEVSYAEGKQVTLLDGDDVSQEIRRHEISRIASDISAIPAVRIKLVELQREIANQNDLVLDGRDIGSYVLPNATVKFYLTASVEERARRRYAENPTIPLDKVLTDITNRDHNDMTREFAPLVRAVDAIEIDSTNMDIDAVLGQMLDVIATRRKV